MPQTSPTGRVVKYQPTLQNIPVARTPEGDRIRSAFIVGIGGHREVHPFFDFGSFLSPMAAWEDLDEDGDDEDDEDLDEDLDDDDEEDEDEDPEDDEDDDFDDDEDDFEDEDFEDDEDDEDFEDE